MNKTVIEYVLARLNEIGINDIFGVAGDYAFPIEDAVCESTNMRWIGNCNELNAAYAADGYARIKGVAALSTTFGVGELSALNGIAGSYAEHLPIFHLVGMPTSGVQKNHRLVHHTLGNGDFDVFYQMSQHLSCAHAILTPENCIAETERLIATALHERRPVYIGLPSDYAVMPVIADKNTEETIIHKSNSESLSSAVTAILEKLNSSQKACIIPGILSARLGYADDVQAIIDKTGLPYATMFMDKSIVSESNPSYMGIYNGKLMNTQVGNFVESCDCVMGIGAVLTDFNSGSFTATIRPENRINILADHVKVGSAIYPQVYMHDVLAQLKQLAPALNHPGIKAQDLGAPIQGENGQITAGYLYPRLEKMFKKDDIIIAETGTASMGLGFALLPENAQFHNQTLWGSIGWATPAAFGAAIAEPHRRVILVTGEGSHQLTAQEVSQFARFGLKPIIFVLNNDGYLIERLLCKDPEAYYNDLPQWNYAQLPAALGCNDWYCQKVTTCDELDKAIQHAESQDSAAYIEIVMDRYASSELAEKLGQSIASLYSF
ncbi:MULTISPECIES: alpha-keto acid decarboxylase family protein [Providencia]|uniref:Alpha-keto acid decarboxylase family protein n=1 Tax=Providencia stuartii TaxID=588 RepID=A0ABD5L9W7_PROST|nr:MULTISPECIES: thiamine pyrophosphate-dependent enzyme [Providencia]ELR5045596.1 alpha-keto acid decarboxylase family protein [Providencia rettgeri]ELR5292271.1 alpha-keto acid decarboxylase family protein [Providencia stuartii]MCR4180044.1 thiamine pyrophosphate-binding protein [Providencia vermicola]URE77131.1 thiamine pyrophosphate-binding protein [Providencia stuartii]